MIVLNLSCRNSPEALEKLLLFIKRFRTEKALPRTQSHFTIMVALWGWTDEEIKLQGYESSDLRSQRVGSRDETVLNATHAGSKVFLKAQPIGSVWPGFAIVVAGEKGDSTGSAGLGCLGPQDTHRRLGCLTGLSLMRAPGWGRCHSC